LGDGGGSESTHLEKNPCATYADGKVLEQECLEETEHGELNASCVAAELRPHVIFLDIGLPEMDGYEVARRLRAAIERILGSIEAARLSA
jgi:CheY-like chemotaxis protein